MFLLSLSRNRGGKILQKFDSAAHTFPYIQSGRLTYALHLREGSIAYSSLIGSTHIFVGTSKDLSVLQLVVGPPQQQQSKAPTLLCLLPGVAATQLSRRQYSSKLDFSDFKPVSE